MRGYVFTKDEKQILSAYTKRGVKIRHFNVIMTLIRRNKKNLEEDLKILNAVNRKINSASKKKHRRR